MRARASTYARVSSLTAWSFLSVADSSLKNLSSRLLSGLKDTEKYRKIIVDRIQTPPF